MVEQEDEALLWKCGNIGGTSLPENRHSETTVESQTKVEH